MAYWMINNVVAKRPSTERVLVLGKKRVLWQINLFEKFAVSITINFHNFVIVYAITQTALIQLSD